MRAMLLPADVPMILVVSHGAFMNELYYLLSESEVAKDIEKKTPKYQNTGIAQYHFRTKKLDENQERQRAKMDITNENHSLEEVRCDIFSCAEHLLED